MSKLRNGDVSYDRDAYNNNIRKFIYKSGAWVQDESFEPVKGLDNVMKYLDVSKE